MEARGIFKCPIVRDSIISQTYLKWSISHPLFLVFRIKLANQETTKNTQKMRISPHFSCFLCKPLYQSMYTIMAGFQCFDTTEHLELNPNRDIYYKEFRKQKNRQS